MTTGSQRADAAERLSGTPSDDHRKGSMGSSSLRAWTSLWVSLHQPQPPQSGRGCLSPRDPLTTAAPGLGGGQPVRVGRLPEPGAGMKSGAEGLEPPGQRGPGWSGWSRVRREEAVFQKGPPWRPGFDPSSEGRMALLPPALPKPDRTALVQAPLTGPHSAPTAPAQPTGPGSGQPGPQGPRARHRR